VPKTADDITEDSQLFAALRLIRTNGIGPVSFQRLCRKFGSPEEAIAVLQNNAEKQADKTPPASIASIEIELETADNIGVCYLFRGHGDYPSYLNDISDAPSVLSYIGNHELLHSNCIGIVGARNCSAGGTKLTKKLASGLSEAGQTIVSGLARGIDAAAHSASLSGGTVACLAGGVDVIYPRENTRLYEDIRSEGLLLSEMPIGFKPVARHFPRRNRIISGLSRGILLIEAAKKSGSLITARFAAEQGREVFAVPGSPLDPRAQGCNQLIKDGASLVQTADDILHELEEMPLLQRAGTKIKHGPTREKTRQRQAPVPDKNLDVPMATILELLSPEPIHIDEIVRLSGGRTNILLSELTTLEMAGEIQRHSGSRFSRISTENK
jgi:DNA processing protein